MVKRSANSSAATASTSSEAVGASKPKKPRGSNVTKSDKLLFLTLVKFHDKEGTLFDTGRTDKVKEVKAEKWKKILRDFNVSSTMVRAEPGATKVDLMNIRYAIMAATKKTVDEKAAAASQRKFKASCAVSGGGDGMTEPSQVSLKIYSTEMTVFDAGEKVMMSKNLGLRGAYLTYLELSTSKDKRFIVF
jgi:hypothetical protein